MTLLVNINSTKMRQQRKRDSLMKRKVSMTWVHDVKVYTVFSLSARNFRRTGGALVGLYIAVLAVSRILSGLFIWEAKFDITCNQWIPLGPSSCRIMCFSFLLIWVCGGNKMILFFWETSRRDV